MTHQAALLGDGYEGVLPVSELCFEDFEAGQVFQLGQHVVSREEIVSFARQYDPQPVHVDEQAARASMLNGLAASGWHTCAVFMRLLSDGLLASSRYAGLVAVEQIRWLLPVRPGDALSGRVTCLGGTMSSPRPGLGVVTFACEALNGRGERVMSWIAHCAFGRRGRKERPAAAAPSRARTSAVVRNPGDHGLKYFEDIRLGDEIAIGQSRFCPDEISAFSRDYDPPSAHPKGSGRACASGWHITVDADARALLPARGAEAEGPRAAGAAARPVARDAAHDVVPSSAWRRRAHVQNLGGAQDRPPGVAGLGALDRRQRGHEPARRRRAVVLRAAPAGAWE